MKSFAISKKANGMYLCKMVNNEHVCERCFDNFIVNTKFIKCFLCEMKLHLVCASIKDTWYKIFSENTNIIWICDNCKYSISTNGKMSMEKENECLKREKELLNKLLQEMEYSNGLQKKLIKSLEDTIAEKNMDNGMKYSGQCTEKRGQVDSNNSVTDILSSSVSKQTLSQNQRTYASATAQPVRTTNNVSNRRKVNKSRNSDNIPKSIVVANGNT